MTEWATNRNQEFILATDLVHIDGSQGEGGGQIVRSSLALAMVTGRPVRLEKVRAGREKPGLMRQHLTSVRAAQQICGAYVTGDAIGSSTLTFEPGVVAPGEYHFAVGTAGSATLVLQTVLPPLLVADAPSRLVLEGGTHNPWAPPFDFLRTAFLSLVNRMGPTVTTYLERHGFYPAGGGRFVVEIQPASGSGPRGGDRGLSSFHLLERGECRGRQARVLLSNLPDHIAVREIQELERLASWNTGELFREQAIAAGPGNIVILELRYDQVTEVFIGFGEHGVKAEAVAGRAIDAMREYLVADVPVGPYLADQLLLPLGLCAWQQGVPIERRRGSFRTMALTDHSKTHINVLQSFLDIPIDVAIEGKRGNAVVTVG